MKMVMLVYNEAIDSKVMEALANCALKNYTKLSGVFGCGEASGAHLGNDVWPGRNNILYVACQDTQARQLFSCLRALRASLASESLKAFILPLEELT
jgi:hypothetical protein